MVASLIAASSFQIGCVNTSPAPRPTINQLAREAFSQSEESRLTSESQAIGESAQDQFAYPVNNNTGAKILDDTTVRATGFQMPMDEFSAENRPASNKVQPVSGDFIETPLRDALNDLAADAGVQLVLDDDVNGVVNIVFEDQPVDRAFELVLSAQSFYHRRIDDTFYVGPAKTSSPLFPIISQRIEYRPKYVETKALLETVATVHRDFVSRIEGVDTVLIEAPERVATRIVARFESIDKPSAQVALEAIVCVIAPDSGQRIGLDWEHAVELDGEEALRFGVTGLGLGVDVSNAGVDAVFSDFSRTSAFVNALCEHGYLAIRAAPHVVAQDGEKASIIINRETFFSTQPQTSGLGESNSFFIQQNIERVESGITFDITPKVRGDMVTVKIEKAEVSEDIRTVSAQAALNQFPIINRRSVSTTVSVKNGRTIVIGGLMQRETVDRESSIPILGSLPWLGHLFKTTERQSRDVEVVIFVSPRIIPAVDAMDTMEPMEY
jgi:type IV pilus assembly protein PilQ